MAVAMDADPLSGRDLAAFVAAVETASMHGAADALALTQSAVSKRVHALERRVGVALLVRGRLGVRATEAGRRLYPEAKQALAALEQAHAAAAGARAEARATLRLAASHTIGEFLLPGWLAGFGDGAPLQFHVDVTNSTNVLAEVRASEVEIGFVEGLDALDGLEWRVIERDELVAVVAPGHPWARRSAVEARELRGEPYLARERDSGTRAVAAAALAARGVELEPSLETPSIQGLKRAVEGGGFTLMSTLSVQSEVEAGTLCALRVRGADMGRELKGVRRAGALPEPARRVWHQLPSLPTRSGTASS